MARRAAALALGVLLFFLCFASVPDAAAAGSPSGIVTKQRGNRRQPP